MLVRETFTESCALLLKITSLRWTFRSDARRFKFTQSLKK